MRFLSFITFLIVVSGVTMAQQPSLLQPMETPLFLSASFGELRPNHFHAGIDMKTEQRCGLEIRSVEKGYVSRVKISQYGYGNCLYVTHPSLGLVSVYAHLDGFNEAITQWLTNYQYQHQTFQLDVTFPDSLFVVEKGDLIAISGNTGSSGGPHLHFEVRDLATEDALEPLEYFYVEDTVRPKFKKIAIRPMQEQGMVGGQCSLQSYPTWQQTAGEYTASPVKAWGKIGLEFMAFDYMNGQSNFYGLKTLDVWVDGMPFFTYRIRRFSFDHDRAINAFIDYEEWARNRDVYMCAYMPQYQPLPLFAVQGNGHLDINEERDYRIEATATDYAGNKSVLRFVIKGTPDSIPLMCAVQGDVLYQAKQNVFQQDSVRLTLPLNALYNDLKFRYEAAYDTLIHARVHSVHTPYVPLHRSGTLTIPIDKDTLQNKDQYYLAYKSTKGRWGYVPATYRSGLMEAKISKLGDYAVLVDTIPPTVSMLSNGRYKIRLRLADAQTDIRSYNGYIDDEWVLMSIDAKNRITYLYDPTRIKAGKHTLRIEVEDNCGNKTTYTTAIRLGN